MTKRKANLVVKKLASLSIQAEALEKRYSTRADGWQTKSYVVRAAVPEKENVFVLYEWQNKNADAIAKLIADEVNKKRSDEKAATTIMEPMPYGETDGAVHVYAPKSRVHKKHWSYMLADDEDDSMESERREKAEKHSVDKLGNLVYAWIGDTY